MFNVALKQVAIFIMQKEEICRNQVTYMFKKPPKAMSQEDSLPMTYFIQLKHFQKITRGVNVPELAHSRKLQDCVGN